MASSRKDSAFTYGGHVNKNLNPLWLLEAIVIEKGEWNSRRNNVRCFYLFLGQVSNETVFWFVFLLSVPAAHKVMK